MCSNAKKSRITIADTTFLSFLLSPLFETHSNVKHVCVGRQFAKFVTVLFSIGSRRPKHVCCVLVAADSIFLFSLSIFFFSANINERMKCFEWRNLVGLFRLTTFITIYLRNRFPSSLSFSQPFSSSAIVCHIHIQPDNIIEMHVLRASLSTLSLNLSFRFVTNLILKSTSANMNGEHSNKYQLPFEMGPPSIVLHTSGTSRTMQNCHNDEDAGTYHMELMPSPLSLLVVVRCYIVLPPVATHFS